MPAVNQFVRCLPKLDFRFRSTGEEYVLVGTGMTMPENFRKWIYCMHQVNMSPLNDAVVPVTATTKLVTSTSKGARVVGIERQLPDLPPEPPTALRDMWETLTPMNSFMSWQSELGAPARSRFARINAVEMLWGLIPVEYEQDDKIVRKVFHVLITVPAPGFNLAHFIREHFFNERNGDKKDSSVRNEVRRTGVYAKRVSDECEQVCDLLEQVVNHEVDINLLRRGLWGGAALNPWTVVDPRERTSVQQILSPFMVMEKMLMHMPGGFCGAEQTSLQAPKQSSLIISGFPDVSTPEAMQQVLQLVAAACCLVTDIVRARCSFNTARGTSSS